MNNDDAPKEGCRCDVCITLRENAILKKKLGPIRPGTEEWDIVERVVRRGR